MKRVLTIAAAVLLTLPVLAEETKKEKKAEPQAKPAVDSPLVAAAKRTNRGAKKRIVITNDDVRTARGHITTTNTNRPVHVPEPLPTPEMVAAENAAKAKVVAAEKAAKADEKKKAEEAKLRRAAEMAEAGEYRPGSDAEEVVPPPTP